MAGAILIGVLAGVLAGMLGIGGGALFVPALKRRSEVAMPASAEQVPEPMAA